MNSEHLQTKALNAIEAHATAAQEYEGLAISAATALHAYRKKQAEEMTRLAADTETRRTDTVKQALVDKACEIEMLTRNLAEAKRDAAKIRIDQLKTEISAIQTLLGIHRAEADAVRYGQNVGA